MGCHQILDLNGICHEISLNNFGELFSYTHRHCVGRSQKGMANDEYFEVDVQLGSVLSLRRLDPVLPFVVAVPMRAVNFTVTDLAVSGVVVSARARRGLTVRHCTNRWFGHLSPSSPRIVLPPDLVVPRGIDLGHGRPFPVFGP